MSKVILGMNVSLDGFVNDEHGSVSRLYPNMEALTQTKMLQDSMRTVGAVVMGKQGYEMAEGDFTGYEFQVPLFVITHDVPKQVARGENDRLSFTFVTEGVEHAIQQAKAAAGSRDVMIVSGPSIAQQALNAGLIDEIQMRIVPVLLAKGRRLFESLGTAPIELDIVQVDEYRDFTHILYRIVK